MSFAGKVWKLLVGIKDGLVLVFMLLFFVLLFSALSARPSPGQVRDGALLIELDGIVVEERSLVDPFEVLMSGEAPTQEHRVHASPSVLKAMKRPANEAKVLDRLKKWRDICPEIAIRSSFVVGFPGETEEDFQYLLEWLEEAQLDRVGGFRFEPVEGAAANDLPNPVPEELKEERYQRLMELTERISTAKLQSKVGTSLQVIIDEVGEPDEDGDVGATGRSQADAPEIDGQVLLRNVPATLAAGDIVTASIEDSDAHDLFGVIGNNLR